MEKKNSFQQASIEHRSPTCEDYPFIMNPGIVWMPLFGCGVPYRAEEDVCVVLLVCFHPDLNTHTHTQILCCESSSMWHSSLTAATVRQKPAAVTQTIESFTSKQVPSVMNTHTHTQNAHTPSHTALVCGISEESVVKALCVEPVSIMLSFSVPFLGSSLRLPLCLHCLHLRLRDTHPCYTHL